MSRGLITAFLMAALTVCTHRFGMPFDWGYLGEDVICSKSHALAGTNRLELCFALPTQISLVRRWNKLSLRKPRPLKVGGRRAKPFASRRNRRRPDRDQQIGIVLCAANSDIASPPLGQFVAKRT